MAAEVEVQLEKASNTERSVATGYGLDMTKLLEVDPES